MAAQASTDGKEKVLVEVSPRQKRILEACSISWRMSMSEIVRACLAPVLDQHEDVLHQVEEVRTDPPEVRVSA